MSEILLIYPKSGTWEKLSIRLPLSIMYVAAALEHAGYKVKIIDQRVENEWKKILRKNLTSSPLFVGISSMTGTQIRHGLEASRIVKEESNVPVVWGGVHVSLLPEQTLENPHIDIGVIGEGEVTVMDLAEKLACGDSLHKVSGIIFKENGKIIKTLSRKFINDLDKLPEVPYHLVNLKKYHSFEWNGERSIDLVTSRGCPFQCSFCYNTVYNRNLWRAYSAELTVERIQRIVRDFGIRNIFFQDDNFCANLKRVEKIVELILERGTKIRFGLMGVRVDTIERMSDDLLKSLLKAGCINMDIGVESGSNRVLRNIQKGISIEKVIEINNRLRRFPFIVKYTFIIGFPGETIEENYQTIDLAKRLTANNQHAYSPFYIATPYPGTKLYLEAQEHGFVPPKKLEDWSRFDRDTWYLNCKSWLQKKHITQLKMVTFVSFLANRNIRFKITKPFYKYLFDLYYPIASLRLKKNFYGFPFELLAEKVLAKFTD